MAWIRLIGAKQAEGELLLAYQAMAARKIPDVYRAPHGDAPGIIRAHSLDATLLRKTFALSGALHDETTLPWARRELINAVTSSLNQCFY
jgi:hypothetical protein